MEKYLQSEYLNDKYELTRVSDLISEVASVFVEYFEPKESRWPYELWSGEEWKSHNRDYSYTTNAMILLALAVVASRAHAGILAPALRRRRCSSDCQSLDSIINTGWVRLREMCLPNAGKKAGVITESGTFGENDPFALTWIAELLGCKGIDGNMENKPIREIIRHGAVKVIDAAFMSPSVPVLLRGEEEEKQKNDIPEHVFPLLRVIHLHKVIDAFGLQTRDSTEIRRYLTERLHRQLSFSSIPGYSFDVAELVFALEGLLQLDRDAIDASLLQRVFAVVIESQKRSPYWRPVKPFLSTPQGQILLPISVEIASSLIRCCIILDGPPDGREGCFSRHVGLFKRYVEWLSSRIVRGYTKGSPAHPDSERHPFVGWHSEHVDRPDRIHLWETSQVLQFLVSYEMMLQRHIGFRALNDIGLSVDYTITRKRAEKKDQQGNKLSATAYWEKEGLSKESLSGLDNKSKYRVAKEILTRFVEPRDPKADIMVEPSWSMLLYGPPGTGKTGMAEDLAAALEFPLVTVTPSDFIRRGEAEVEARAKDIFDALGEQVDMVVLFDEIDQLILDRDAKGYSDHSDIFQLMTPSMLPKLKNLRSKEGVIFILGTNFVDRIDPAAKRTGRIDHQFLVAPPDDQQRAAILHELLTKELEKVSEGTEWLKVLKQMTNDELEEFSKMSTLAIFTELKEWVKSTVRELKTEKDISEEQLIGQLKKQQEQLSDRTVRLLSYDSRFRWKQEIHILEPDRDNTFPFAQEPFEEFLILLYLKLQGDKDLEPQEKKLVRRVIGRRVRLPAPGSMSSFSDHQSEVHTTFSEIVRDKNIVDYIVREHDRWF